MTQPSSTARDGQPAGPAPDITAARSRADGGTGPGMPLSIWPGLPGPGTPDVLPYDGGPATTAAARRVIDAFSAPGDLVAAAGGCSPAVTEAAAATGRRVLVIDPGPVPALLRPGGPAALPPPGDPDAGTAGLAIAACRAWEPGGGPAEDPEPLLAACERVLWPGAVLAVITGPAPHGTLAGAAGSVTAAARAAGLLYAQHIVLVRAGIDGDRLAPAVPGSSQVHDDLFVFSKPGRGGNRS